MLRMRFLVFESFKVVSYSHLICITKSQQQSADPDFVLSLQFTQNSQVTGPGLSSGTEGVEHYFAYRKGGQR